MKSESERIYLPYACVSVNVCMYVFFFVSVRLIMLITPGLLIGTNYSSHKHHLLSVFQRCALKF